MSVLRFINSLKLSDYVAVASLIVALVTLFFSYKTAKNTKRIPQNVQKGILKDMPRHFYRNLLCTVATLLKYNSQKTKQYYPSGSNVLRSQVSVDDFLQSHEDESVNSLEHEIKLNFRNYNCDVLNAAVHFSQTTDVTTLEYDYDNLLFKPLFLVVKSFDLIKQLPDTDKKKSLVSEAILMMFVTHFEEFQRKIQRLDNISKGHFRSPISYATLLSLNATCATLKRQFKKYVDKSDALQRSFGLLYKYYLNESTRDNSFLLLESGELYVDKDIFLMQASEYIESRSQGLLSFVKVITHVNSPCDLEPVKQIADVSSVFLYQLYDSIKVYFDVLKQDVWKFEDALLVMICVDACIHTRIVGMVLR